LTRSTAKSARRPTQPRRARRAQRCRPGSRAPRATNRRGGSAACWRCPSRSLRQIAGNRGHGSDRQQEEHAHRTPDLEVDPRCGRVVGCDVEVHATHGQEKGDPYPCHPRPHRIRKGYLLQQRADQVPAEPESSHRQDRGEQPIEDRRLPLDESLVVKQQRGATEDRDDREAQPMHDLDLASPPAKIGDLRDRRDDCNGGRDIDVPQLEGREEEKKREVIDQKLHNLLFYLAIRPASKTKAAARRRILGSLRATRNYRISRRNRGQSKAGPGSVLRPGATSLWPATSALG